jgi:hypothetical protein
MGYDAIAEIVVNVRAEEAPANMGHPSCYFGFAVDSTVAGEGLWYPTSRRNERDAPEFPARCPGDDHVCAFLQGKAHKVRGTHKASQEIGSVGHPAFSLS